MKKSIVFKGVYPALITPFKKDGSMDLEGLKANVKHYMSVGCAGVAFSGSSGEHAFLTREERIAGVKACKEVIGDGYVIAGAGAQTTAQTKEFLKDTISDISNQLKTQLAALNIYNGILQSETENLPDLKEFTVLSEQELDRIE